jgi:4'-phosphopantetheinyl transferase EntD
MPTVNVITMAPVAPVAPVAAALVDSEAGAGTGHLTQGNGQEPTLHSALQRHAPVLLARLRMHWAPAPLLALASWPRGTFAVALPLAVLPSLQHDGPGRMVWAGADAATGSIWTRALPRALWKASPQRIRSFVAGRLCAEEALRRLNASLDGHMRSGEAELLAPAGASAITAAIGLGPHGEPLWPSMRAQQLLGSITHSERWAVALVCPRDLIQGIGIDCEECMDAQAHAAARLVCFSPQEFKRFPELARDTALATVVYAAKEAFYKAIWPRVQRFVDFMEVEVMALDRDGGVLRLDSQAPDVAALLRERWLHRFTECAGTVHAVSAMFATEDRSE